jgi:hypothetical protein
MKSANRPRSFMLQVSIGSISYQIISDAEAIVEYCDSSIKTLLPRNSFPFSGNRVRVTHLNTCARSKSTNIVIIPYSIHTIFDSCDIYFIPLPYLVFENGCELRVIDSLNFKQFSPLAFLSLAHSLLFENYVFPAINHSFASILIVNRLSFNYDHKHFHGYLLSP